MKRVGLFFGSFNPIHVGHLIIADHMAQSGKLDEVWIVVSPRNPFKEKSSLLDDKHRLRLVEEAVEENPRLKASNVEFALPQPSYTVHTLAHLKEKHPKLAFDLIMGEDNLRGFHKWLNTDDIQANHRIWVYPRVAVQGEKELESKESLLSKFPAADINYVEAPVMKISASQIRKSIKEGKDVRYMLTEPVYRYVTEMHFYR